MRKKNPQPTAKPVIWLCENTDFLLHSQQLILFCILFAGKYCLFYYRRKIFQGLLRPISHIVIYFMAWSQYLLDDWFYMFLTSNLTCLENSCIWPALIFKPNIISSQLILFFSLPKIVNLVVMLQVKSKTLVNGQILILGKVPPRNIDCKIFWKFLDFKMLGT